MEGVSGSPREEEGAEEEEGGRGSVGVGSDRCADAMFGRGTLPKRGRDCRKPAKWMGKNGERTLILMLMLKSKLKNQVEYESLAVLSVQSRDLILTLCIV